MVRIGHHHAHPPYRGGLDGSRSPCSHGSVAYLTPMVGRGPELAAVTDALATSRAVVVVGEAGIGKSRLVSEAVATVEERGDIAVTGRCLPLSAGLPLLPIIDLLRHLSEVESGRLWKAVFAGLPESTRWEIRGLLPEVEATSNVEERGRVSGLAQQARLFDALRQVLRAAGEHGVAVVVEDVHWADQTTRDLLEYLLGSAAAPPTSLVLTCRSEDSASAGASEWLLHLPRLPGLTFVHVGPLDHAEATAHLHDLAGEDVGMLDVDDLVRRSEGNAFFLEQLARSVLQGDVRGEPGGLPSELRSVPCLCTRPSSPISNIWMPPTSSRPTCSPPRNSARRRLRSTGGHSGHWARWTPATSGSA